MRVEAPRARSDSSGNREEDNLGFEDWKLQCVLHGGLHVSNICNCTGDPQPTGLDYWHVAWARELKVCRTHSPQSVARPSSAALEDLPRRLGLGAARPPSRVRYLQLGSTAQSSAVQTFDQLTITDEMELLALAAPVCKIIGRELLGTVSASELLIRRGDQI
ncbi:uncharacterized protein N7443_006037 [Penicillium atrosanguineum]|uniref:Uncharacterized protein n=1 Tax=Penicillium atrosanguineum TaxID=1132637 RepID=A0A9W9U543_9EURO|nr:uncharacterized protein N7443_006037 [Penicillium atrosanguineum]KAJ5128924.1 hypothetical protein N7526_007090 [Penicillium atrosanguineum]KAJ5301035.1 hypothetical protein N7443_006037 [Penicillium atrosanguineum]KAJ5311680.1 hypothetical protein N7476_007540 [Penicillium atrosanguineum]